MSSMPAGSIAVPDAGAAIVHGDCADVLAAMPAGWADLAYLDPPFATGAVRRDRGGAFDDRWPDLDAYLAFMDERLGLVHRALGPNGAVIVHCDWRTSHHLRIRLDDRFGADGFVNHIVWTYGLGGSSPRRFARKHDDLLYYAKSPSYYFDPPRVPARSQRMKGQSKKATDVLDIPSLNNMARERTGYPTQKPLALLEVLVGACSPPGGVVLDPFCGSGTTVVAAVRLGRRAVGIDRAEPAVTMSRSRACEGAAARDDAYAGA